MLTEMKAKGAAMMEEEQKTMAIHIYIYIYTER